MPTAAAAARLRGSFVYEMLGGELERLQSSGNRNRFGGKEEQRIGSTDLKLLDFGARYYDAFACRWTVLDPLAWKYPAITPYSYCAGDPVILVDVDGRDGMLIGSGTKQDPYIVVATYYYQTNSLNKEQIDGLKAAMADYNQSLLKVKDKEGRDVFVSFNLTLQETDNPQEERLKVFFTDLDGNPHYFGNIVTTEMNNNDRYGYATCLEIGFSISKIQSGIDEGMNAKSLTKE